MDARKSICDELHNQKIKGDIFKMPVYIEEIDWVKKNYIFPLSFTSSKKS